MSETNENGYTATPIADGYYRARPAFAAVDEKDAENFAIRIGWKAYQTAPVGGAAPEPVPEDVEIVFNSEVLIYGPNGQIYDFDARNLRTATMKDTQNALARMARLFPAWAAFRPSAKDDQEFLSWFVDHIEEFRECDALIKVTHSTKDGRTFTNCRIVEPRKKPQKMVDRAALAAKYGKAAKAALKGVDFGIPAEAPKNAPRNAPSATHTPTPPKPRNAPVPPPATPKAAPKPTSVDDAYAEWCKQNPLKANGEAFYAFAEEVIGNADFESWTPVEWGRVLDEIIPF